MFKNLLRTSKASMGIYESDDNDVYGVLAEYKNPGVLVHAAKGIHQAGYKKFDTHSPFPIHGMDKAMGMGNSKVGYITIFGSITGLSIATWMQWWMGQVDYPINISGKPFFAVEPSIPVMFELTILLSAFAAVAGMLALNGLPRPYNPLFYSENFSRATDDAFFVFVAASDDKFNMEKTSALLKELGALNIEVIKDHGTATVGVDNASAGEAVHQVEAAG